MARPKINPDETPEERRLRQQKNRTERWGTKAPNTPTGRHMRVSDAVEVRDFEALMWALFGMICDDYIKDKDNVQRGVMLQKIITELRISHLQGRGQESDRKALEEAKNFFSKKDDV